MKRVIKVSNVGEIYELSIRYKLNPNKPITQGFICKNLKKNNKIN